MSSCTAWPTMGSSCVVQPPVGSALHVERDEPLAVDVDVLLELGDLLLDGGDRVGAGDESAERGLLVRHGDERLSELGRVARLLAVRVVPRGHEDIAPIGI